MLCCDEETVQTMHKGQLLIDDNTNMIMLKMGIPTSSTNPYTSPRKTITSAASEREALETTRASSNTTGKSQNNNTKKVNDISPPLTQPPNQHHNDNNICMEVDDFADLTSEDFDHLMAEIDRPQI